MYIIENKNIYLNYNIIKIYNAGIKLEGWEVKSIKNNHDFQIKNSQIIILNFEIFIKNSFINIYNKNILSKSNRERKLLLNKKEISEIIQKINKNKFKLIIIGIYLKEKFIKIKIALSIRKKKNYKKNEKKI